MLYIYDGDFRKRCVDFVFYFNLCQFCAVVGVKSGDGVVVEFVEYLPNIHRPWVQFPAP